ncbi:MAG: hypothetical protein K8L97_05040 [Anaerolineae bacterium]|nr:hypothetical protein [Anaerolineae bacterium]
MLPIWKQLEQVFTVETIMTPRRDNGWLVWEEDKSPQDQWDVAEQSGVDMLPVLDGDKIIGVRERINKDQIIPFADNWLISERISIRELVEKFAISKRTWLFASDAKDVIGIVTPADLNKLPARTYFYSLLAELEMLIAKHVRNHFGQNHQAILALLNNPEELEGVEIKMRDSDMKIDIVHFLDLSDLIKVIKKKAVLREKLGLGSANQVKEKIGNVVELRHNVMHPVRLILNDKKGIDDLDKQVRNILSLLGSVNTSSE